MRRGSIGRVAGERGAEGALRSVVVLPLQRKPAVCGLGITIEGIDADDAPVGLLAAAIVLERRQQRRELTRGLDVGAVNLQQVVERLNLPGTSFVSAAIAAIILFGLLSPVAVGASFEARSSA